MTYSEVLASLGPEGGGWVADVPETWLQGRSLFGGLQSALALRALRTLVPSGIPLRVLQTTFVAPVPAGKVRVETRLLRQGKSVVHAEARLVNGGETACVVIGIFGAARASRAIAAPKRRPPAAGSEAFDLPFLPGLSPSFAQHFQSRWLAGPLPFSRASEVLAFIETRLRDPSPMNEEVLVALADLPPPMAFAMLDERVAGSSLSWTLELLVTDLGRFPNAGNVLECELVAGGDGYTSQSVTVWAPTGEALALSRQSMVVFG
jgi:hypothetical protein